MQNIYNGAYFERLNVFFTIKTQRSQFLNTGNYRQGKEKKNRANNMASSSDDEINTMKVGDTFHNHLEEKKKGKIHQENPTAKTNVKTVKEKEKKFKRKIS